MDTQAMAAAFESASGVSVNALYYTIAGMVLVFYLLFAAWQTWRLIGLWAKKKIDTKQLITKIITASVIPMFVGAFLAV